MKSPIYFHYRRRLPRCYISKTITMQHTWKSLFIRWLHSTWHFTIPFTTKWTRRDTWVEDEAALRRANSRWRSWRLGWFHWFNYGLEWRSWALQVSLTCYNFSAQFGPFRVSILWKEPF